MENGETTAQAAMRETDEEAGANIIIDAPFALISIAHINQVHLFYRGRLTNPNYAAGQESLEVKLQPADAFGEYDAELVIIEPRSLFPDNIEMGTQFERGDEDDRLYTITDITEDKVVVDGNHPLAGIALIFSCSIADVRAGTAEEISHGHVHGAHGHHH